MRSPWKILILCVLALVSPAWAQPPQRVEDVKDNVLQKNKPIVNPLDPVVTDEPEVTEVELTAPATWKELKCSVGVIKKLRSSTPANWLLVDDARATLSQSADGKEATFTTPENGRFRIIVIGDNRKGARVALTAGDGPAPIPPGPGPIPVPPPGPQPKPVAGKVAKFVVVEDSTKGGQWRGDILGSPAVANFVKTNQMRWQVIDKNAPEGADAEALSFLKKAEGKTLPFVWLFDKDKVEIGAKSVCLTPEGFLADIGDATPHKRALGNNPPNKVKYAFKKFGSTPSTPLIPRKDWKQTDLSAFLPPVYDQDGRGQCHASATCTAIEMSRNISGLKPVKLSAGDLYDRINGGQDQGSTLEDGLAESMSGGVATAASVPYVWDGRHYNTAAVKAERQQYVVLEAYLCDDFEAMASAIQQGFPIIEGLLWYDNFTPDRDGWLPTRGGGGAGGHALCGFGLSQRNGVWGIRTRNSWSAAWGNAGNCVIPESLFGQQIGGFWAIRSVRQTGTDFPVTPSTMVPKRYSNPFEKYEDKLVEVLKP